jgi:hypothetical protein
MPLTLQKLKTFVNDHYKDLFFNFVVMNGEIYKIGVDPYSEADKN